jgi:ubiquinone/menaquinone biosynthesis C-methylase UbiE
MSKRPHILKYEGNIATIQRRLAQTSDLYRRRLAVLDAIAVQPGESVLEVGCGGGALLPSLAAAVGETGSVVGIDISADQITAANQLCADIDVAEAQMQDANQLPYEDASFDAIVSIQVIEYLDQPARALSELRRVLGLHGRLVILATNWDTMFWNSGTPELTARVRAAWRKHAPHPNLAAELRPLLADAGFRMVRQAPVTIINNAYHEDALAYWLAQLISAFAIDSGLISQADASAWMGELEDAQAAGTFFFSSTPVLTIAVAA